MTIKIFSTDTLCPNCGTDIYSAIHTMLFENGAVDFEFQCPACNIILNVSVEPVPSFKFVATKLNALTVTLETCPVCQTPDIKVEHGAFDEFNRPIHVEHCPECGDLYPVVCFDCPHCKAAEQKRLAPQAEGVTHAPLHI
jgi:hypothetical protein